MIIDGRNDPAAEVPDYDLVIVGAGPVGITIAAELEGSGIRCALLESGGREFDAETQELYDGEVTGNDAVDLTAIRLRMLGGTTNHWGGYCVPLDPIDFERGPGNGLSGWPFGRSDLDPFYRRAHPYCDLGDYAYGLEENGIGPDQILLADHPRIESRVIRRSPPTRFGEKYLPVLERSADTDLWLWTNAVHFTTDADGRVDGVETRTLSGREGRIPARAVVLASGAVENARLLLAANARNGSNYGARGDLLGACYMDHPTGGSGFLHFASPAGEMAYWAEPPPVSGGVPLSVLWRLSDGTLREHGLRNAQFYVIPFAASDAEQRRAREAGASLNALKHIVKWSIGRDPKPKFSLSDEYCTFITNADSFVTHTASRLAGGGGVSRALLKFEAEQLPSRESYVALDDATDALGQPRARLHWAPGEEEFESVVRTTTLIGQFCGEAGLGRVQLEERDDLPYWGVNTSWHQLGTTRMATSETSGVVDTDLRVFGTQNLFVAGGSVMPTSGCANPTLTILALSIRLADHLKQHLEAS